MSKKTRIIEVQNISVAVSLEKAEAEFISITDIARYKNAEEPKDVVKNWMRNRGTIEFLGLWEKLHNPEFKGVEFDSFMFEAGSNSFVLSPSKWIDATNAKGIRTKSGNRGGTFAHRDIALEFASWVSAEFKLYLLVEFQRLKDEEQKQIGWDIKRNLASINYRIHTDAIKVNLTPPSLTKSQTNFVYATEADVLNVALFGITAKQWRDKNPGKAGNIRDYASVTQLICLSNLESLNAVLINEGIPQSVRLQKLNQIAIQQMSLLAEHSGVKRLENKT
ncbi:MAG: KilA-N domain-containing protein [Pyrinomonadaceae bacterium]